MNKQLSRLKDVIQSEATTTSKGDFLITHAPFTTLYLDNSTTITEDALLQRFLLSDVDDHKLIMIQGGNGSGKSHLIRWLKEKYETVIDSKKEAVLFISRAHNNLQDALKQLLDSDIFPDEVREETLKKMESSRGQYTVEEFKKLINYNFNLVISGDDTCKTLEKRDRLQLSQYILNPYVLEHFLMIDDGPLDRMRARIETTADDIVIDGDAPVFSPDDFNITIQQIQNELRKGDNAADGATLRLAERFADYYKGKALRENVADYLNSKVSIVIRRSMDLKSIDFQRIFEDLRKDLKQRGSNLTLFIEDINAFTGIDESLMEALLTDHRAEGNHDCCRLMSVVGSTIWFYENKLNSSIRERIKANVYLREGSVLSENNLVKFAARYINAINLDRETVDHWYNNGAAADSIPVAKCDYDFAKVDIDGKCYSIFPFNERALKRLYSTLEYSDENNSYRTPRVFLKEILLQLLTYWYQFGTGIFSKELFFKGKHFSIPNWADFTYENSNRSLGEEHCLERSIILRVWGDGTTDTAPNSIGGVSKEVFDAFGIPFTADVSDAVVSNPEPMPPVSPDPWPPNPEPITIPSALARIEKDIADWCNSSESVLVGHQDLRDWLVRFILSNIHWEKHGIPYRLAEGYISRKYLCIEGQQAAIQVENYYLLKRCPETRGLLIALTRWKYLGNNSWEFDNCLDYLTIAFSWLETHEDEICNFVVKSNEINDIAQFEHLGVTSVYLAKSIIQPVDISLSAEDLAIVLFKDPIKFDTTQENRSSVWEQLVKAYSDYPDMYNAAMAFFKKVVGGRRNEDTSYTFIDAYKLLGHIEELRENKWELPLISGEYKKQKEIKKVFFAVIQEYKAQERVLYENEHSMIVSNLKQLKNQLPHDYSQKDISETFKSMKDFLKFIVHDLNLSYTESDYVILSNSNAAAELYQYMKKLEDVTVLQQGAEFLSALSGNPNGTISEYIRLFQSFGLMMSSKISTFNAGIDRNARAEIKRYKCEAERTVASMLEQCDLLEEV